jgi:phospholipase C
VAYPAAKPAVDPMTVAPYHEFTDVVEQLCGAGVVYPHGGPYPPITNSGFVANFVLRAQPHTEPANKRIDDVMKCFAQSGLPVLSALAKEFAVCDSWYSSLPDPTWPNRFFARGASSAELDHSPTTHETALWQTVEGFKFQNGSIFDASNSAKQKLNWRIYAGQIIFTRAHALQGIHIWDIQRYERFASDLQNPNCPAQCTWIEPNYGHVTTDYIGGNSQHPLDGVTGGEALIKATYGAIRKSPLWNSSLLIITWGEHGGYYANVAPPAAVRPGDQPQFPGANKYGFTFDRYGPRVPAVVISPLIPRNLIDHRTHDQASIPATVQRLFDLQPLTARDRAALDVAKLATLPAPRADAPDVIGLEPEAEFAHRNIPLDALAIEIPPASRPDDPIDDGHNLPGFVYLAAKTDAELPPASIARADHLALVQNRVRELRTRSDAQAYFEAVRRTVLATEPGTELETGAV